MGERRRIPVSVQASPSAQRPAVRAAPMGERRRIPASARALPSARRPAARAAPMGERRRIPASAQALPSAQRPAARAAPMEERRRIPVSAQTLPSARAQMRAARGSPRCIRSVRACPCVRTASAHRRTAPAGRAGSGTAPPRCAGWAAMPSRRASAGCSEGLPAAARTKTHRRAHQA